MKRVLAVSEYNDPRKTRHRLHLVDADDPFRLSLLSVLETPDVVHSLRNRDGLLYCSMPKGFSIYDVSSLEAVEELSHLDLYGGISMELSSDGNYAYLTSWKRGITIVDVHNPCNPFVAGLAPCNYEVLPDDKTPFGPYGVAGLSLRGNYLFCVTCDYTDDKHREVFIVYDIADPSNPQQKVMISTAPWRSHGMVAQGDLAYASGFESILVFDISEPLDPVLINRHELKARMCCNAAIRENLLFSAGSDYAPEGSAGILSVFDITNPLHIRKIGETPTIGRTSWNLAVVDDFVYVVSDNTISAVEIANPERPTVRGLCGPSGASMVYESIEVIGSSVWDMKGGREYE